MSTLLVNDVGVVPGGTRPSASLSDKGSKVTYANKNEAADGLGTRLYNQYCVASHPHKLINYSTQSTGSLIALASLAAW